MGAGSTVVDCISTCLSVNASQGKLPRMRSIEDELVERQIPQPGPQQPVLRIYDTRIHALTNGSGSRCGSRSFYFHHSPSRCQQKTNLKKKFSAYYFLKVLLHHFLKVKSRKKKRKSRNHIIKYGSGSIPLTNGSGSRRPKNTWIQIRNTDSSHSVLNTKILTPPLNNGNRKL
jgi:hypothetical protein